MTEDHSLPGGVVLNARREGQAVVVELSGEIDMSNSVHMRDRILELLQDKPSACVINMAKVKFIDSSGVATLVEVLRQCRQCGCRLRLAELVERVRNVFDICRLETMFQIYASEAEALS